MDTEGEEKCQGGEKEETLKHQNGMFEGKKENGKTTEGCSNDIHMVKMKESYIR